MGQCGYYTAKPRFFLVYKILRSNILKNGAIIITILTIAGCIVVAVLGTSISHIGSTDIHYLKDKDVVHKPEFDQFQQRVIDRLDDIKTVQQVIQEDIKAIRNSN